MRADHRPHLRARGAQGFQEVLDRCPPIDECPIRVAREPRFIGEHREVIPHEADHRGHGRRCGREVGIIVARPGQRWGVVGQPVGMLLEIRSLLKFAEQLKAQRSSGVQQLAW